MAENNSQIAPPSTVKGFMALPETQRRVEELLGDRASNFMTSVSSMIGADAKLAKCEPISLFMACLTAAALNLPINKNLGFAHIIPYGNEAQFQMGWRGYVQLAQRTGQYKTIAATAVRDGQLVEEDPLEGNTYDWKVGHDQDIIGYVASFTTVNGFRKEVYMSTPEIRDHADKYSKAYNKGKGYGPWKDNFDAMALKTVIKMLISKWGIMSVDLEKAVTLDSAVVREDGTPSYIDGQLADAENERASEEAKAKIIAANSAPAEKVHEVGTKTPPKAEDEKPKGKSGTKQETLIEEEPVPSDAKNWPR